MKQKEILLFGASGQIGRNLIRKLTQNNYKVTAVTRNTHRTGYIIKTQANPGYLNLVEIKNFDPEKHEAISLIEDDSLDTNTIIDVVQKGYTIMDRTLRPAKVVVSKKSQEKS